MMESLRVLSDSSPKYENCSFMFHRKKKIIRLNVINTIFILKSIFLCISKEIIDHDRCSLFVGN